MTITSTELNKLHQLKQKVRLISADIKFLKQCKKNKIFPNFIKIKIPVKNQVTDKVLHNAKINWLNLEIKHLYAKQANFELQAYELHLLITKELHNSLFSLFQEKYSSIIESIEYKFKHKTKTLDKKYNTLVKHKTN